MSSGCPLSKNAICCHYFYTLVLALVFKVPKNMLTIPTPNLLTHLQPHKTQETATAASTALSWKLSPCAPAAFETSPTQAQAECRIPTFPQQTVWVFRCWAVVRGARSFWFLWSLLSLFAPIPGLNPVCQHFANFSPIIPQPGANKNCNLTG